MLQKIKERQKNFEQIFRRFLGNYMLIGDKFRGNYEDTMNYSSENNNLNYSKSALF